MNIDVYGIEPAWERSLDHLIRLFFAEPQVRFFPAEPEQDWNEETQLCLRWRLQPQEQGNMEAGRAFEGSIVICTLTEPAANRTETGMAKIPPCGEATADETDKGLKNAYSRALFQALAAYSGMTQPWGILTGVRPTKLVHQMKLAGMDRAEISRRLAEEYLVAEHKIELLQMIADKQLRVIPDLHHLKREVSIYIGIPFCPTKCAYCTFPAYAIGGKAGSVDTFLACLHVEMERVGAWLAAHDMRITTVYFGGGTPTSISAQEMDQLYTHMYRVFPHMDKVREITVEAGRPDTITPEKINVLKKHGIDRISINPQSYIQETLRAIGRHHTVEETVDKFWLARNMGMRNINMDLIIGLPGEGMAEFAHSLAETAKLLPESLTVHTLSFKRASEMTQNKEKYRVAERGEIAAMVDEAYRWTKKHGYAPYYLYRQKNILGNLENVGYAQSGKESIYNIIIMEEMQTIIGLGCGATSKWVDPASGEISRHANPKEPKAYAMTFLTHTEQKIAALNQLFN